MDERVQIFISSHKPCERAESGFVRTVMQADVIRDLEGGDERDRFMAAHANEFCELLTQYWAWKRCGAPYVGFGHTAGISLLLRWRRTATALCAAFPSMRKPCANLPWQTMPP